MIGGETTAGSGSGSLVQQLINGDVYVERGMRVNLDKLRQTAAELKPTVVKFAVFNSNSNSKKLASEADRIRTYLKGQINQGQGYVIAASRRGVAVSTTSISKSDLKQLTDQVAPLMEAGSYTDGLSNLARGLARERAPRAASSQGVANQIPTVQHGPNWFVIFLVGIAVVVVVWLIVRSISNRTAMSSRKDSLERDKSQVISGMNYLEENASAVDARAAGQINEARIAAGTKLDEASRLMRHAGSDAELQRAQSLLDQAQADISRGRSILDRALRGEFDGRAGHSARSRSTCSCRRCRCGRRPAGLWTELPRTVSSRGLDQRAGQRARSLLLLFPPHLPSRPDAGHRESAGPAAARPRLL